MASVKELTDRVFQIIESVADIGIEIKPEHRLAHDLCLDLTDRTEVAEELEKEFGIVIGHMEWCAIDRVAGVIELVKRKVGQDV